MNKENSKLVKKLLALEQEHGDLDEVINHIQEKKTVNFLQVQRLKKRKLILKDKIKKIKDSTEPDIIA